VVESLSFDSLGSVPFRIGLPISVKLGADRSQVDLLNVYAPAKINLVLPSRTLLDYSKAAFTSEVVAAGFDIGRT
jgi:hypothetical protein